MKERLKVVLLFDFVVLVLSAAVWALMLWLVRHPPSWPIIVLARFPEA